MALLTTTNGIENLQRCFHGLPDHVARAVHICCGYPDYLDQENFQKADQKVYLQLSDAIEDSSIGAISLEDAHRHNDLSLLEQFKTTTVMLGVIAIANSRIETVTEITERLQAAFKHIDADRLIKKNLINQRPSAEVAPVPSKGHPRTPSSAGGR